VLVCLALVSDGSWRTRLSIIFDIFKSTCTNELFAEDIMLGLEVVMQACLTLWTTDLSVVTNRDEVHALAEEIAIAALDKVRRELKFRPIKIRYNRMLCCVFVVGEEAR
jgi:hypothetical protein